jgi:deoxyribodipyrimidine photolyase-related protein
MTIRLVLGDQLNLQHSWYKTVEDSVCYVMFEMRQETDYVKHHVQKVVAFFAAMRQFAQTLESQGHQVIYLALDASNNQQDLGENLQLFIREKKATAFEYQAPDEYRLDAQLIAFCQTLDIVTKSYDTEHFLTTRQELETFFEGKKNISWSFSIATCERNLIF